MNPGAAAHHRKVFLFSGQGSQYFHMGRALLDADPCFRGWMRALDQVAAPLLGESVLELVYDPARRKSEPFRAPRPSSAAILMSECALAFTLAERGVEPDAVCGSSLGEFSAAVVAGALSFAQALRIVLEQAACFERHCEPGAVLAVLAPTQLYHRDEILRRNAELVLESEGSHFVVAGAAAPMRAVLEHLRAKSIPCTQLPVAFGFHSSNIDAARPAIARVFEVEQLRTPRIPLYSCARPGPVQVLDRDHFWQAVRGPIRLGDAIDSLPRDRPRAFIDVGPSGSLANQVRQHGGAEGRAIFQIMTPYDDAPKRLEQATRALCPAPRHRAFFGPRAAWLFPGQGSQHKGMGRGLFERFPGLTAAADEVLGYRIAELCLHDREGRLRNTAYTQPALYVVNALSYRARLEDGGVEPAYVAGHSLGEYNALLAAGVFEFSTGLQLVVHRGALMARAQAGGMAAILGLSEAQIREVIEKYRLELDIANLNEPTQIVVAGPHEAIVAAQPRFEQAGCRVYVRLNVSGAFHSRWMRAAAGSFAERVAEVRLSRPRIPVISNVLARPYPDADMARLLVDQISQPVRWTDTITYLAERGVEHFDEVGPGGLLSKLTSRILGHTPEPVAPRFPTPRPSATSPSLENA